MTSSPTQGRKPWKKRQNIMMPNDVVMVDGRDSDIVILVMGKSGVGKSTFINILLGQDRMKVGHSLASCTTNIEHAIIEDYPNVGDRRVVLVDTPGFDETYMEDAEVLRRIAVWLAASYSDGIKLAGIIYLQNICERRLDGATRVNLDIFRKIWGKDAFRGVVIVTAGWTDVVQNVGVKAERDLKEKCWKDMICLGSKVLRFDESQASARKIIDATISNMESPTLRIQHELVDDSRLVPETDAAKELRHFLEELLQIQKNLAAHRETRDQADFYKKKIAHIREQIGKLQPPLGLKLLISLGLRK